MTESATRLAPAHYRFDPGGGNVLEGEADALVTDEGVTCGPASVDFLDADGMDAADWRVRLALWPAGELVLSQLGRRFDTFAAALREARAERRVRGMLAHGTGAPERYAGTVFAGAVETDAILLVYSTHLTVVPAEADPWQLPFGAVRSIRRDADAWRIEIHARRGAVRIGRLARKTDAFHRALAKAWDAQKRKLAAASGSDLFADGDAVSVRAIAHPERLLAAWTAPERAASAAWITAHPQLDELRLGLVELLDYEQGMAAPSDLGENVAAFLLARFGDRIVMELLSGPSAATYAFRGSMDDIGADLQELHFRRRALSFTESELSSEEARPYRLALRRLAPLARLRAATVARLIHGEGWENAMGNLVE
ncbi:MAG TPA: hypothetical protein VGF40_00310 [Thermoanaerobaculia bacterium]